MYICKCIRVMTDGFMKVRAILVLLFASLTGPSTVVILKFKREA